MAKLTVLNSSGKPLARVLVQAESLKPELVQHGVTNSQGNVHFDDVACRTQISVRDHSGQRWKPLSQGLRSLRGNQELTYWPKPVRATKTNGIPDEDETETLRERIYYRWNRHPGNRKAHRWGHPSGKKSEKET